MKKLFLYNTLTRQNQEFVPLNAQHVKMYVCGPTVYDYAHIGNARPVVVFDTLYRLLQRLYPQVTYVRNITDVDDKITAAALAQNRSIYDITATTIQAYHDDMAALHALRPDVEPKATEHIQEMIEMISVLIAKGHAYCVEGHVLFGIESYGPYGQLSKRSLEDMRAGARVEIAPYKKDPGDFVLWKPSSLEIPGWESPWGRGRPGWHIECSAMSAKHLGSHFDIHGGGIDLVFPHHENERAQSCTVHDHAEFVQHWLHNGWVTVEGEKMSKSLGNFITVHDLLKDYPGEVIRLALLASHYRQPLDWTMLGIRSAKNILDRLYTALRPWSCTELAGSVYPETVMNALKADLNIPLALRALQALAAQLPHVDNKLALAQQLKKGGELLGILQYSSAEWFQGHHLHTISKDVITDLVAQRQNARVAKDFATADSLRHQLEEMGIILEDTAHDTQWRWK